MTGGKKRLADAEARERIEADLDATLFVEAAAGTGKTTALVHRMLAVLRAGKGRLDQMVAVTFTEKAAGELRLRLRLEIETARAGKVTVEERERLEAALEHLELAHISTIHEFCASLLRLRPVEARVDPRFRILAEDQSERLLALALDRWLERALEDPPEGLRRILRRPVSDRLTGTHRRMLLGAVHNLAQHRDHPAPWTRVPFDRERAIDELIEAMRQLEPYIDLAYKPDHYLRRSLIAIQSFIRRLDEAERLEPRDYDGIEAGLAAELRERHWTWKGGGKWYGKNLPREEVLAARDAVTEMARDVLADANADLAPALQASLGEVVADYERLKQAEGTLDFLDLLIGARDLLVSDWQVRSQLQKGFSHFYVDEFQDTDPLQAEILLLLASDCDRVKDFRKVDPVPGKLFIVGDPKQSIYRFRRADIQLYDAVKQQITHAGGEHLHLTASFRSTKALQAAVNQGFSRVMKNPGDGSQADYVALSKVRDDLAGQPSVIALPAPRPLGAWGKVTKTAVNQSFPDAAGAFVEWLLKESGWRVTRTGTDGDVPVESQDVCILLRRFQSWGQDLTAPYVRALEMRQIPHVLVGGHSFHEREEVTALRNVLHAIEWPDDRLSVYACLKGPFFAFTDGDLLEYRTESGSLHPLAAGTDTGLREDLRPVAEALQSIGRLHRARNRRTIVQTISRLLEQTRAHAAIGIWPTGRQALTNLQRFLDQALRFELQGARSFRAFVDAIDEEADSGQREESPVIEEGTPGVRIMTVHRAKGLEFPVVLLADPGCPIEGWASRWVEADKGLWAESLCGARPTDLLDHEAQEKALDEAEALRIAYVAVTRARDLLVVPAIGTESANSSFSGWLDPLKPVVYPAFGGRRSAEAAPGCPVFGEDSLYDRHPAEADDSVMPGLHVSEAGTAVTWWDPAALRLDVEEAVGRRQEDLLQLEANPLPDGLIDHMEWSEQRALIDEAATTPSLVHRSVTQVAHTEGAEAGRDVSIIRIRKDDTPRRGGKRFGALVHAVLETVDLKADEAGLAVRVDYHRRLLGATEEEARAAGVTVSNLLAHPALEAAKKAGEKGTLHREMPIMFKDDEGELIEGVIDMAFESDDGWTIIDFKTDQDLSANEEAYRAQVALYMDGLQKVVGEANVEGRLLVL